jgi:hypothetical protein
VLANYLQPLVNGLPDLRVIWFDLVRALDGHAQVRHWPVNPRWFVIEPWYAGQTHKRLYRPCALRGFVIRPVQPRPSATGFAGFADHERIAESVVRAYLYGDLSRFSYNKLPYSDQIDYCKAFLC